MIDLVRWIGGPVASVTGHVATLGHEMEAEDTASVSLRFVDGTLGEIVATTCATPEFPTELRVYGDRGHVRIVGERAVEWDVPGIAAPRRGRRPAGAAGHRRHPDVGDERRRLPPPVRGLRRGGARPAGDPVVTGEDGRNAVEIITAAYEADRTGRAVTLGGGAAMKVGAAKVDITPAARLPDGRLRVADRAAPRGSTIRSTRERSSPRATTARRSRSWSPTCSRSIRACRTLVAAEVLRADRHPPGTPAAGRYPHPQRALPSASPPRWSGRSGTGSRTRWFARGRAAARPSPRSASGTWTGIGGNRRPNGGPVDDRVTVTRFDGSTAARSPPT